jgi:hypothetical protein
MIDKDKIHNLVGVFYQPTFKTFFINSVDGESFIKPIGIFVSLGITTSTKVLDDIKNVIADSGEFIAQIAELSSKKAGGQFINTIVNIENPQQFELHEFPEGVMNEEEAKEELERMKSLMTPEEDLEVLKTYAPRISQLQDLIEKLTNTGGWNAHLIQKKDEGTYSVFHKFVNYQKVDDIEYRIGIYVREKE